MKILYTNNEQQTDDTLILNTSDAIYIDGTQIDTNSDDKEHYIKIEDERGILISFLALNNVDETSFEKLSYYIEILKDNVDKIVLIYSGSVVIENECIVNNDLINNLVNNLELDALLTYSDKTTYSDICINDTNIVQIAKDKSAEITIRRAFITTDFI